MRRRHYKIQEVIKRRQIILVQVVKEERGNKGAALTTYLSLAGRYCVLMPNTPRGGGISRKITNANDRKRLKSAAQALELPEGMGLIIRTAGENRTKVEIKRDYEYLLRMWDTIRELTLKSNAPACVYEEGDLIKRAIRDLYNKDVSEIVVEGEDGYRQRQRLHAHADAEPCEEREALQGARAAFPAPAHRSPARRDVLADRNAEVGRLHRHQPDRSACRHRREFGPRHARAFDRGHRLQDQSRSGRGNRRASCACAISPASSSSISSTWKTAATTAMSRSACAIA